MGDVFLGFLIGTFFTALVAIETRDRGRDDCERSLPRTEKCVQQWTPERATHPQEPKP